MRAEVPAADGLLDALAYQAVGFGVDEDRDACLGCAGQQAMDLPQREADRVGVCAEDLEGTDAPLRESSELCQRRVVCLAHRTAVDDVVAHDSRARLLLRPVDRLKRGFAGSGDRELSYRRRAAEQGGRRAGEEVVAGGGAAEEGVDVNVEIDGTG